MGPGKNCNSRLPGKYIRFLIIIVIFGGNSLGEILFNVIVAGANLWNFNSRVIIYVNVKDNQRNLSNTTVAIFPACNTIATKWCQHTLTPASSSSTVNRHVQVHRRVTAM